MYSTDDHKPIVAGHRVWYLNASTPRLRVENTTVFNSGIDPRSTVNAFGNKIFLNEGNAYNYRMFIKMMREREDQRERLLPVPYHPLKEI